LDFLMRLTLAQLEAFYWTARFGSVQRAARQLNLAQPTVSLRLKSLQEELGVAVFERSGWGIKLTRSGELLFGHARNVLDEIGRIRDRIGSTDEVTGVVKVGVPETFAVACLPGLLQALARDHPALRLELTVSTSSDLEREVAEHRLELAFVVHPSDATTLRLIPLGLQEASWMASPALGLGPTVRPADLARVPLFTNPAPSAMHRQITQWFSAADVEPKRLDICTSVMVIAHLVEEGVAAGFLPTKLMEEPLRRGTVERLDASPCLARVGLYAAHRVGAATRQIETIVGATRLILQNADFLVPPPEQSPLRANAEQLACP
jgi:DNA-binding transcriptional LysR family regulator